MGRSRVQAAVPEAVPGRHRVQAAGRSGDQQVGDVGAAGGKGESSHPSGTGTRDGGSSSTSPSRTGTKCEGRRPPHSSSDFSQGPFSLGLNDVVNPRIRKKNPSSPRASLGGFQLSPASSMGSWEK
ncbi:hypothetical protein AMECASPLE_039284 [Ameca splendens]|uniref:Uncharacterized protein n=1 Tax=Ameca splendens TaxID=208324 RepID=A0ABV0ZH53_9TELE